MAGQHNIIADIGTTVRRTFYWSRKVDGVAQLVDLTGASAYIHVRQAAGSTIIFNLTEGDGLTLGGPAGSIAMLINASDWPATPPAAGNYAWNLVVTLADATVVKLLEGAFVIKDTL